MLRHVGEQRLVLEPGERLAHAIPARQHDARLRPAEHPGDGAQILDPAAFLAAGRARSDLEPGNFLNRRQLAEEIPEPVGAVDQVAIGGEGAVRQLIHRPGKARGIALRNAFRFQTGEQGRAGRRFQIGHGDVARAEFGGDHFALFRDADTALHAALGLGLDRGKGRAAAAPDRTAPTVEQLHRRAGLRKDRLQRLACLVEAPGRGDVAAILVAVGIADHHFLMAPRLHHAGDFGQPEIGGHDLGRGIKIADGFEQRDRHDRGVRRIAIVAHPPQPRFLEQDVHFQQVGDALRHGNDIMGDALRPVEAVRFGGGMDDRQFRRGFVGIGGKARSERAVVGEFAAQQRDARIFVEREIIRLHARDLEQFGNDAFVHGAVLAHVERREVEAEGFDRADEATERAATRQRAIALARQPLRDDDQIMAQVGRAGIGFALERRWPRRLAPGQRHAGGGKARIDAAERTAIGFILAA